MKFPSPRLRMWHLIGLVAAIAAFLAVGQYRREVYDPASLWGRRLRHGDAEARLGATQELSRLGPAARSAIEPLIGSLTDGDARVRAAAARSLRYILPRKAAGRQAGAVEAALTAALRDRDPSVQHAAAITLYMLKPDSEAIVPPLVDATYHGDAEIRAEAVNRLGDFAKGRDDARRAILAAMRDPESTVRAMAIHAVAMTAAPARGRGPAPVDLAPIFEAPLVGAMEDEHGFVRAAAVEALGRLGAAPRRVEEALGDPEPYVRQMAVTFSGGMNARSAIPALIRATTDADLGVRCAAASRLGQFGADAEGALPALLAAMDDPEVVVRRCASEAARGIAAKVEAFRSQTLPGAIADLGDDDPEIRRLAAEVLGESGTKAAPGVPALIRSLTDQEPGVRRAASRALGRIGPAASAALPALGGLATDEDEAVRRAAAAAQAAIRGDIPAGAAGP